ncbi:MAG: hypothetical protein COB30_019735 [Ectothiorhodospiraceae bacterium]|nr:hypothetical protein [Ectothiorhodospiraceae bacterium]
MTEEYLSPSQGTGGNLASRKFKGEFFMLNLLRFRDVADYSATPELASSEKISGREAYQIYIDHTLPLLKKSGGDIHFLGSGGEYMIGPAKDRWDLVMIIRQKSIHAFSEFASNKDYNIGFGHRQAALEDSRLLPIEELVSNKVNLKRK